MAKRTSGRTTTVAAKPKRPSRSRAAATPKLLSGGDPQIAKARAACDSGQKIDQRIQELGDWRGATLQRMRALIHDADPDVVEEWKWQKPTSPGTPVWSHDGIICTGEHYRQVVKLTFMNGASLRDPKKLFNASLEGNVRRAIDIREGEHVDEAAFKALVREAVAFNVAKRSKQ